jgi:hypothetical protein
MISLSTAADVPAVCDPKVSRVQDYAEYFYAKTDPVTMVTVTFWRLRKPLGVYPAGTVMTLATLHRILFA